MNILETSLLVKCFAGRSVLHGVGITIARSQIVGLLGRNGAGKTTACRVIAGVTRADAGEVRFNGEDVTGLVLDERARRGIGYVTEEPSGFGGLTVRENLLAVLESLNLTRIEQNDRAGYLLEQVGLTKMEDRMAGSLKPGERRRMEIARALVTEPELIILDEPFKDVDSGAVEGLQAIIHRLKLEFGTAVLITDHNVRRTLKVCDKAIIINDGHILFEGTPKQLLNDADWE